MVFIVYKKTTIFATCIGTHDTIEVNGVSLYYEKAGQGDPIILVSCNGGSHKDLHVEIRQLTDAGYQAYAIDSRGQGANAPLPEYHYEDMAEDVYQFIEKLEIGQGSTETRPAFYGWSDGGIIGLLLAIRHPDAISKLAVSGANITPDGLNVDLSMGAIDINPLTKMIYFEPDIQLKELEQITIPVLVTAGETDLIKDEHTRMFAEHIPDARLLILEQETHGSYIVNSEKMGQLLLEFLEESEDSAQNK